MIAANKRFLKANLTQGVLGIQTNLVQLYTSNLTAMATQAALIGGFSFTAVLVASDPGSLADQVLGYFYYVCFAICLVTSLFILSEATIVVMFGPTMALKGATDDAVKFAANHMREQQMIILKAAWVVVTSLFLGACIMSWANYEVGIAAITTVVYIVGYYALITQSYRAFRIFVPSDDSAFIEPVLDASGMPTNEYRMVTGEEKEGENRKTAAQQSLAAAQEATKLKVKAHIWKRQSIEDGGLFVKYFGVLDKGRLDLYAREKDYRENANPVNSKPIKLWQYDLELDHRKYSKTVTSLTTVMKSSLMGNEDFGVKDLMTSEYDLQYASRNFKFGLVPKVSSELVASTVHEFLAHDDKLYKLWTESLSTVVGAFDEIAANPSVEHTIRVGTADVELVVQAANNQI
mmetsp:Transcript_24624/g.26946  ORF Transcript_24624/g.26946 Transcript_24624/m.26946 type:complete len:405 (-) Transcript_24624:255-1469(-)|eukprot:gene13817-15235_t